MEFVKVNASDPFAEELFVSEIDIEEHAIKLEPEEDPLQDCPDNAPNRDEQEPSVKTKLPECRVLVKKLLECDSCRFYTTKKTKLRTHVKSHLKSSNGSTKSRRKSAKQDDSQPVYVGKILNYYECDKCDLKYFNADMYAWHTQNCHGPKATIQISKYLLENRYEYRCLIHLRPYLYLRPGFMCTGVFNEIGKVIQHLCIDHKSVNLPFHCNICNDHFTCEKDLNSHKKIACQINVPTVAQCPICYKVLKSELYMKKHILKFHDTSKTYTHLKIKKGLQLNCKHCDKSFTCYKKGCTHCVNRHPEKFILHCKTCDDNYILDVGYTNNKTKELNGHEFRCYICNSRFGYPMYLKRHMDTVHSELPKNHVMKCYECKKSPEFVCEVDYHRHIQQIHTISRFYCEHCTYNTGRKRNITWHILHRHL